MIKVRIAVSALLDKFEYVNCLETGTIRSYDEKHESTRHISEIIGNRGKLKSIDVEEKSINISKDICKNADNVEWILSDSIKYLKNDNDKYHFVLLDSVNNPDHILEEFKLVANRIEIGGCIMVDDAGIDVNHNVIDSKDLHTPKKGVGVNAFLIENDINFSVFEHGRLGNQLLIEVNEENSIKLKGIL